MRVKKACDNTLLRRVLSTFARVLCRRFYEGFLEGVFLRREALEGHRRQKHAFRRVRPPLRVPYTHVVNRVPRTQLQPLHVLVVVGHESVHIEFLSVRAIIQQVRRVQKSMGNEVPWTIGMLIISL